MIEAHFGKGMILVVMSRLHRQAELQGSIILDSFVDFLPRFLEKHTLARKLYDAKSKKQDQLDLRDLDKVLTQVALLSQKTNYYIRFLKTRIKREVTGLVEPYPLVLVQLFEEIDVETFLPKSTRLSARIQDLMNDYLTLEQVYIQKSIETALKIAKYEQGATSTCVDDVFFILKNSTDRCVGSLDMDALGVFMSMLGKVCQQEYIVAYQKKLSNAFGGLESREGRVMFMILLNDIDVSCEYMNQVF